PERTATGGAAVAAAPVDWRDWRRWPEHVAGLWHRSLRFRTIVVALALTALAILIAGVVMSLVIQRDLFDSRKAQVLDSSLRAAQSAQQLLDATDIQGDPLAAQQLLVTVGEEVQRQSPSNQFSIVRIDAEPSAIAPLDMV